MNPNEKIAAGLADRERLKGRPTVEPGEGYQRMNPVKKIFEALEKESQLRAQRDAERSDQQARIENWDKTMELSNERLRKQGYPV